MDVLHCMSLLGWYSTLCWSYPYHTALCHLKTGHSHINGSRYVCRGVQPNSFCWVGLLITGHCYTTQKHLKQLDCYFSHDVSRFLAPTVYIYITPQQRWPCSSFDALFGFRKLKQLEHLQDQWDHLAIPHFSDKNCRRRIILKMITDRENDRPTERHVDWQ